jgi:hypothetical protein
MSRDYEGHLYPAPNVSKQTQSWTCAIERKINKLEQRTSDAIVSANHAANRWAPMAGEIAQMRDKLADNESIERVSRLAQDAVTWSTRPPVNRTPGVQKEKPDYPLHPNAVWYVYVGDKNNVTEIWRWEQASMKRVGDKAENFKLDMAGKWVRQTYGTGTLGEGAVDLKNLSKSLSDNLEEAHNGVVQLQKRADEADKKYDKTKADLEKQIKDIKEKAGSDGRVIVSPTEPAGADRVEGNLWINTADGKNEPYRYDKATDKWVLIKDPDIVEAAKKAAQAQTEANQALKKAQGLEDMATAAKLAAEQAQKSADGKNTIFYRPDKPPLAGRKQGDLWFDTDDGYRMYSYDQSRQDFVDVTPKTSMSDEDRAALERLRSGTSDILEATFPVAWTTAATPSNWRIETDYPGRYHWVGGDTAGGARRLLILPPKVKRATKNDTYTFAFSLRNESTQTAQFQVGFDFYSDNAWKRNVNPSPNIFVVPPDGQSHIFKTTIIAAYDPNNRENVVVPWIDGLSSLANNVWLMGVEMTNNDNLQARLAQASQGVADTFRRIEGQVLTSPYPPSKGVVNTSVWMSPDGKLFRMRKAGKED